MSPTDLRDWEEQNRTFDVLGGVAFGVGGGPLLEGPDGSLQSADRQTVTARFFDVLGVRPWLAEHSSPLMRSKALRPSS